MTAFIDYADTIPDDVDAGFVSLAPFEVDGIHYQPGRWEAIYRPPLLELRADEECYCAEEDMWPEETCSSAAFRWIPDRPDTPPLRFGAKRDGGGDRG